MAGSYCSKRHGFNILKTTKQVLHNDARYYSGFVTKPSLSLQKQNVTYCQCRSKITAQGSHGLHFPDRKMGREEELRQRPERSTLKQVSDGLEVFKKGMGDFKEECNRKMYFDENLLIDHNDYKYFAKFDENTIKKWSCTSDSDVSEGKSTASLEISPSGKALFSGFINTEVPKDGYTKKAGFCNISSPLNYKSFERQIPYDWTGYTDLFMRVRGDGRNYMIILQMDHHYSVHFHDMYNYPLYTHGGPYWQYVKIPFSSFYLAACGRMQDTQVTMGLDRIRDVGITAADGVQGDFQLEIDYIAVLHDENTTANDFEYELYKKHQYTV